MTHSSSTASGTSDTQSEGGSGPLSLDAFLSVELFSSEQTDPTKNNEKSTVVTPYHRDGTTSSPEDFATPTLSNSPEDPEDIDHEEEADNVDQDLPEADSEDGVDNSDEDDGVDTNEDEIDGHTPFTDTGADSDSHQRDVERTASPRDRDKSRVRAAHEDKEITFADLGLPGDLLRAVTDTGFVIPTAIQKEAIPVLLVGRDVVGVTRTGTGKTAAFGPPLLDAIDPCDNVVQAFILAPTCEFAPQSAEAITDVAARSRGLEVVAAYGGAPYSPQIDTFKNGAQVVVGTPDRIIDLIDKGALQLDDVRYFILDEADETLWMGFAEDVKTIAGSLPADRHIALFSATMPPVIQAVTCQRLHESVRVGVPRPVSTVATVRQTCAVVPSRHRVGAISRALAATDTEATIIFVRTESTAEDVVIELTGRGIRAVAISGNVPQRECERLVGRLCAGTLDVLVATDIAARGPDVDRTGLMVNFDIPREVEAHVHRIGRTGRAGRHGEAVTFLTPKEEGKFRQIEHLTGSHLEEITLPSPTDVPERRACKLLSRATTRHERGHLDMYLPLVANPARELDVDVKELATTLLTLAMGDEGPRRHEDRGGERPQCARREENLGSEGTFLSASFEGGWEKSHRAKRGDHGEGRRSTTCSRHREYEGPGTVYRVEVRHRDRVLSGATVGTLANEGGIEGPDIDKIGILQSFSLVATYADLSSKQLSVMGRTTFAGCELRIRSDEGPGHGWSGPNGAERRPKRCDWEDRENRGGRSNRGERSERGFCPRREDGERGWRDHDGRSSRGDYNRSEREKRRDNRRRGERRGDRDGFRSRCEDRGGRGYDRGGHRNERRGCDERNQNCSDGHRGGPRGERDGR